MKRSFFMESALCIVSRYVSSWGWSDKEKLKELYDDRMWYLLALQDGNPVGFTSFRYDLDFKVPVLYW